MWWWGPVEVGSCKAPLHLGRELHQLVCQLEGLACRDQAALACQIRQAAPWVRGSHGR